MDSPIARMSPLGTMSLSSALALSASVSVVCATIAVLRLFSVLPRSGGDAPKSRLRPHHPTCKLSVFLGSGELCSPSRFVKRSYHPIALGGHTSESLAMISGLDFKKYQPRVYYVSEGDTLSAHKAIELERRKIDATRESSNEVSTDRISPLFPPEPRSFFLWSCNVVRLVFSLPAANKD